MTLPDPLPTADAPTRRTYGRVDVYRPRPLSAKEFARQMRAQRRVAEFEDSLLRPRTDWGRIALATLAATGWSYVFALLLSRA